MLRRDLLAASLSGLAVAMAGRVSWAQKRPISVPATAPQLDRILVLVELRGGNDGLNTVVPYADPAYRAVRQDFGIPREQVVQLDEKVGLHQHLAPMLTAWKAGDLAILHGLGYPNPNRSHFRSIEIWDTASAATETLTDGWLAQAFTGVKRPPDRKIDSVVIDANALPASGGDMRTVIMEDTESFINQAKAMRDAAAQSQGDNPALDHILKVRAQTYLSAIDLAERLYNVPSPSVSYGAGPFAKQLEVATRILMARVPVLAVKVALRGFDTHAGQRPQHDKLMAQLGHGLANLRQNLVAAGRWNDVLVMTYSEFGRRVRPNASGGTDHGAAAAHFVMGGAVKGGLHGAHPSLIDLNDGDLKHAIDFRNVFGTVAKRWWGLNHDFGVARPQVLSFIK